MEINLYGIIAITIFTISGFCFLIKRNLRYLHFLQQDEYSPSRFLKWYIKNKAFDKRVSIVGIVFIVLYLCSVNPTLNSIDVTGILAPTLYLLFSAYIIFLFYKEPNPLKQAKLKLNLTKRAKKILYLAIYLELVAGASMFLASHFNLMFILVLVNFFIPLFLCISVIFLSPFEQAIQCAFISDAKKRYEKVSPFTIAVVGSYGKSTVKNMLGEILQGIGGNIFWPKAGINTLMGITREIREKLKDSDKTAIIEMGTYRKGSITETCKLTPPNAVILTAINHMHLERFKTRENIYKAKTEVVQAMDKNGILVCNADDDFTLRAYKEFDIKNKFLYGMEKQDGVNLDAFVSDISYTENGTTAKIFWKGTEYNLKSQTVGKGAISSILACFTMACAKGYDPKIILAIISEIKPLSNRLELKKYPNDLLYLQDGYNSNPIGFASAIDVLEKLNVKRRIVMTPGIIELGSEQFNENKKIAKKISKVCDKVFFVGAENKASFEEGFKEENFQNVTYVGSRDEAFNLLSSYQQAGDAVLIENDLPDWYESDMRF